MPKLHELIAVEGELKSEAIRIVSDAADLFTKGTSRLLGKVRKYRPLDEMGEKLPDEVVKLATTVGDELETAWLTISGWLDVTVQKELTNGRTSADVVVDGKVVLKDMSAPALLNLEQRLTTLRGLYESIPTLDPSEPWEWDGSSGAYVSRAQTYRTKKVPKALVGYEATPEHPAQVQYYQEDIREGVWDTTQQSGMLSLPEKRQLLSRVDKLARAVKEARQRANSAEAVATKVSDAIKNYIHSRE